LYSMIMLYDAVYVGQLVRGAARTTVHIFGGET